DYERALTDRTAAILRVHQSNFRIVGFTEQPALADLARLADGAGLVLVDDLGSGVLVELAGEPSAKESVEAGAGVVTFSGDKLLGGPQAGIIVGSRELVSTMRKHPLTRALRADKLCLAALEATLNSYIDGTAMDELPTPKMLHAPPEAVEERAWNLAAKLDAVAPELSVNVVPSVARSGGGTLPVHEIPSYAVLLHGADADVLAAKLRGAEVPVVGRAREGGLLLDARTLLAGDEERIVEAMRSARE
ncbi:MAG: L-seryl-tRNA(Sec) selenium transferase, partial [Rubrobacteraceae bacterium]